MRITTNNNKKKRGGRFIFSVFPLLLHTFNWWGAKTLQPHVPPLVCQHLAQLSVSGSVQLNCGLLNCNQDAAGAIAGALCSPVWPV